MKQANYKAHKVGDFVVCTKVCEKQQRYLWQFQSADGTSAGQRNDLDQNFLVDVQERFDPLRVYD